MKLKEMGFAFESNYNQIYLGAFYCSKKCSGGTEGTLGKFFILKKVTAASEMPWAKNIITINFLKGGKKKRKCH
ncbi:hypothetical protein KAS08_01350 [Candidatus Pacearchaeota archaeon]|nr:hypothetical protein [Candidatus Pacearchaeota archaeon]